MTMTREIVNSICAGVLSGIVTILAFTMWLPWVSNIKFLWLQYVIHVMFTILILYLVWRFFDWRNKFKIYRQSFKLSYWTGIFSSTVVTIYFNLNILYRNYFFIILAIIAVVINIILKRNK